MTKSQVRKELKKIKRKRYSIYKKAILEEIEQLPECYKKYLKEYISPSTIEQNAINNYLSVETYKKYLSESITALEIALTKRFYYSND